MVQGSTVYCGGGGRHGVGCLYSYGNLQQLLIHISGPGNRGMEEEVKPGYRNEVLSTPYDSLSSARPNS